MHFNRFLCTAVLLSFSFLALAQSPVSGFMNGKGHGAIAVSYTAENYDKVFLVPNDAVGIPVFNEVDVTSISLYATYSILNNLDAVLSLPYIQARGQATEDVLNELGFENERDGIQDVSAFLKYRPFSADFGSSSMDLVLAGGVKTPLGDYKVAEGLQSILAIGNRATSFTGMAIAQFRTDMGWFVGTQAGYSLRSGEVPNAFLCEIKAGYGSSRFYADLWFASQVSDGGVNILGEGFQGFFPATDVSFNRAGLNIYVPIAGGFGVSAGVSKYLNGRNVGQATGISGSVVYSF